MLVGHVDVSWQNSWMDRVATPALANATFRCVLDPVLEVTLDRLILKHDLRSLCVIFEY